MYSVIKRTAWEPQIVRTIGIVRARCKIGMTNLVYNMRRLVQLERMAADARLSWLRGWSPCLRVNGPAAAHGAASRARAAPARSRRDDQARPDRRNGSLFERKKSHMLPSGSGQRPESFRPDGDGHKTNMAFLRCAKEPIRTRSRQAQRAGTATRRVRHQLLFSLSLPSPPHDTSPSECVRVPGVQLTLKGRHRGRPFLLGRGRAKPQLGNLQPRPLTLSFPGNRTMKSSRS